MDRARGRRHAAWPVAVVGAGPAGLTAAIELAQYGVPVVLLDEGEPGTEGSRAICFAKRSLDVFDRLGCGEPIAQRGVSWNSGKVFFGDDLVYAFDLLPERGQRRPAFVNLQQYLLEGYLVERARALPACSLRFNHRVVALRAYDAGVELDVATPGGTETLTCEYVIACDGARSALRDMLGLQIRGRSFKDRFLIADVRVRAERAPERWFWFDPPFHRNQSALVHRQADNVWRCDFQLGWDADPIAEREPERVLPRVRALLGDGVDFTLEWVSVYTFSCGRLEHFRAGRVFFAGDSAHLVSPFGARGANGGIQDAENVAWKLRLVLRGFAPEALLDTYDTERVPAADENIRASTRATDFITPKSAVSRAFRDAVLGLAREHPFARALVNSGRLSVPYVYAESPLNTRDGDAFAGAAALGAPAPDAPVTTAHGADWFLAHAGGAFTAVYFADGGDEGDGAARALADATDELPVPLRAVVVLPLGASLPPRSAATALVDAEGLLARRYDVRPGTCYVLRPDQHVCARRRSFDAPWLHAVLARASCAAAVQV